jgi:Phage tail protein (Tail_P2_I)
MTPLLLLLEEALASSPFGLRLFDLLEPWQTADLAAYCQAIGVMFDPVDGLVSDHGNDGDPGYVPGWGQLFDVDTCPFEDLPYLAQYVGVQIPKGSAEAQARALVRAESGMNRGTLASVQSAIERSISTPWTPSTAYSTGQLVTNATASGVTYYLVTSGFTSATSFSTTNLAVTDPTFWYRIFERQRPDETADAYALTIYVRPEQLTPVGDTTAITTAVTGTKPGGIILYLIATDSPRWEDTTLAWNTVANTVTWANVQTGDA